MLLLYANMISYFLSPHFLLKPASDTDHSYEYQPPVFTGIPML